MFQTRFSVAENLVQNGSDGTGVEITPPASTQFNILLPYKHFIELGFSVYGCRKYNLVHIGYQLQRCVPDYFTIRVKLSRMWVGAASTS